jgi:hypothetical protein
MSSPICDRAIGDILTHGKAILKFISPNDVGLTGGHQYGYYLPRRVWQLYTPQAPEKGVNHDHHVTVLWENGLTTNSVVKWYGKGTRSEYRLTHFGRGFPYLDHDFVGSLLVLVIRSQTDFLAYVFDLEEDIEAIEAALGIQIIQWAAWNRDVGGALPEIVETPDDCLDRRFRAFTATVREFPSTTAFSAEAEAALEECIRNFLASPTDDRLMQCVEAEYRLFRMVERKLSEPDIVRVFASIEQFLETAQMILQRRKARAGRSLENHVETILRQTGIPFEMRATVEATRPDVLIPGSCEYLDRAYPTDKLFAIGVKTTCKDRWRQVLREAVRVQNKHILTIQAGISPNQLQEMEDSSVTLIVPKSLHKDYPPTHRDKLLTIEQFIGVVRDRLNG